MRVRISIAILLASCLMIASLPLSPTALASPKISQETAVHDDVTIFQPITKIYYATNEYFINASPITVTTSFTVYLPIVMNRWPPIPYNPTLNTIDNADQDANYILYWSEQPAQLADTYVVQEATNATFTAGLRTVCTTWQQSCSVTDQKPGTYYYRVMGSNGWGNSAWSNIRSIRLYPMYVGLSLQWDGNGYIRGSEYADVGHHWQFAGNNLTDADTIRFHGHEWYDPDPYGWGSLDWDSELSPNEWTVS